MEKLPKHLQKYIVEQNYEKYTPVDQAVWRYILRQLKKFLGEHAHQAYLSGLEKTGISTEYIPRIEQVSAKLEKFGWRALPVSGFIPPAAFMELQSMSILPIASDMRSLEHLLYTPAPDIVHEAAGHAPILADEEYAQYLKEYAQVAKKAIMSQEDLNLYEAIRELSDIKENPTSSPQQIHQAEEKLKTVSQQITFVSEASELSRMNWWTAEYGLIGSLEAPKIFGAGLLSSVGESKWCLSNQVKKIPLTLECVKQTYDITEPQPQLFVARDFQHLKVVLHELSETMAYKIGGLTALNKILQAQTVNTVELNNGIQISGKLKKYHLNPIDQSICYLQFEGPTQLSYRDHEITGHSSRYHSQGYGTPIGPIENFDLHSLKLDQTYTLKYTSGVTVKGVLTKRVNLAADATLLTFSEATCEYNNLETKSVETLFHPEWGDYDIVITDKITSCFGGPADRNAFGEISDFVAARVPSAQITAEQKNIFNLYQQVRAFRENKNNNEIQFKELFLTLSKIASSEWLLFVELIEIGIQQKFNTEFLKMIEFHLKNLAEKNQKLRSLIEDGLALAYAAN